MTELSYKFDLGFMLLNHYFGARNKGELKELPQHLSSLTQSEALFEVLQLSRNSARLFEAFLDVCSKENGREAFNQCSQLISKIGKEDEKHIFSVVFRSISEFLDNEGNEVVIFRDLKDSQKKLDKHIFFSDNTFIVSASRIGLTAFENNVILHLPNVRVGKFAV